MSSPGDTFEDRTFDDADAPTRLERPSLAGEGDSSQGHGSGSIGSRSTHATPAQTLRHEEIDRTRVFLRIAIGLCVVVAVSVPILGGDAISKTVLLGGLLVAFLACVWFGLRIRDPVRYTPGALLLACYACVVGALAAIYYFGLFSPASVVIPFGLYFFGLSQSYRATLSTLLICSAFYFVVGGGIVLGLLDDHGLITAGALDVVDGAIILGLIEVVFVATYLLARATRRANLLAIEEHDRAVRRLAMREALLREAQHDLQKALEVGGVGRYSDELIGPWRLGKVIGRGGIGEVYDARHVDSGIESAVKLLQPQYLTDIGHVRRFLREAKAAGALEVPNVVRILDVGDIETSTPYIAMERLHGKNLGEELLERRRLPLDEVLEMMRQVGRGLERAHAAGIVHRDLKPHNLYVTDDGVWKILDFGISKLSGSQGTLTQGQVVGTPAYMAPEQAEGRDVDERTDIYALGVITYRVLTGRPAFAGKSVPDTLYKVVHTMPPAPGAVLAELAGDVERAIAIAMAKRAADRYARVSEWVDALALAARGELPDELRARADAVVARLPWSG